MKYLKKLFTLVLGTAILVGIPYTFGTGWLWTSWIPALFVITYLDE